MTKEGYLSCLKFFTHRPVLCRGAIILQKACEIAVYIVYPLFLALLLWQGNGFWWRSALVCGISFIAVTVARMRINAERPYEKFGFEPLIKKEKKGQSFPSRHAFSAAIIAVNVGIVYPVLGIVLGAVAIIIAFLRVVLGVHFIKDVLFGLVCGAALGLIALI